MISAGRSQKSRHQHRRRPTETRVIITTGFLPEVVPIQGHCVGAGMAGKRSEVFLFLFSLQETRDAGQETTFQVARRRRV